MSMSNYPPGVSGNEYEIAGPDYQEELPHKECPECGVTGSLMQEGYRHSHWVFCIENKCNYREDVPTEKGEKYK
jgi:hypothetical protein